MTQSVTNNVNNIEQMLTSESVLSKTSGMDNAVSSFETRLDKAFSTIKDVKNKFLSDENIPEIKDFREILSQTTKEVNVETSLDLTLARDINEIISQLKEAVENAEEMVDIAAEEDVVQFEEDNVNSDLEKDLVQEEMSDAESNIPFEQIISFVNNDIKSETDIIFEDSAESETSTISDVLESADSEIIEFAENVTDKVNISKSAEEKQIEDLESLLDEDMLKELNVESVKAETDTSGGDNLMNNQTPAENAIKAMISNQSSESFDMKLESVQEGQTVQSKLPEVNSGRIIEQISKQIEGLQNNSKINIVLNPESLGKVDIQLLNTKDGLTAQFTVTTQEARDLIMKGLDGLKETLASHGVGFDNVSVKVSDSQKSEYQQDWTEQEGSNGGYKNQEQPNREEKEKGLFEKMMAETTEKDNGKV